MSEHVDHPDQFTLNPVAYVRTRASDEDIKTRPEDVESDIDLLPAFEPGLAAIDGFSHLMVLFFMHRLDADGRTVLQVKPRRLLREGLTNDELPTLGVFACDSPVRPNPIGLSLVRLLARDGLTLHVQGLDAFDGTPVLDIKPYTPKRVPADATFPNWWQNLQATVATRKPG